MIGIIFTPVAHRFHTIASCRHIGIVYGLNLALPLALPLFALNLTSQRLQPGIDRIVALFFCFSQVAPFFVGQGKNTFRLIHKVSTFLEQFLISFIHFSSPFTIKS